MDTAQALVDLPFLALVVAATDREARRPRQGLAVPVLLLLAGLLRPEALALGAVYLLYRREHARRLAPLLAAAPVLWALVDLWATGDPLHSLHGTRELADILDRPQSTGTALTSAPGALRDAIREPLLWVALAGAGAGLVARPRASLLPGSLVVFGLVGFLGLGVAGLPLLGRYLVLPACMLLVFAGWRCSAGPARGVSRAWWPGRWCSRAFQATAARCATSTPPARSVLPSRTSCAPLCARRRAAAARP